MTQPRNMPGSTAHEPLTQRTIDQTMLIRFSPMTTIPGMLAMSAEKLGVRRALRAAGDDGGRDGES